MASGLVALEPPAPHRVGLVRRVDRSAAARIGAGTPHPQNSEAALRRRCGLLAFSATDHVLRDYWGNRLLYIEDWLHYRLQADSGGHAWDQISFN